jgi:hypothetical protein
LELAMIDKNVVIRILSPILQKGFCVLTRTGVSVKQLLEEQFDLSPDFIEREISTIFLDGKAVDNIDRAIVTDRCELALSGAMPGFVGAAMRRGGYYSSMRAAVSHIEQNPIHPIKEGIVKIKLYNTLIQSLGLEFAQRGIIVSKTDAAGLLGAELSPFIKASPDANIPNSYLITIEWNKQLTY